MHKILGTSRDACALNDGVFNDIASDTSYSDQSESHSRKAGNGLV